MKKIWSKKYFIFSLFTTLITSACILIPITFESVNNVQKKKNFDLTRYNENKNAKNINFVGSKSKDLIDHLNDADINLFYNSAGTITSDYMLRLAMIANTGKVDANGNQLDVSLQNDREVHFAYSPDGWVNQSKINYSEFANFFKLSNKKSSLINVHNDSTGQIVNYWKKIIQDNPTKKINIWWNVSHLTEWNGTISNTILELAGFNNVNIELLEDGSASNLDAKITLENDPYSQVNSIENWSKFSSNADENLGYKAHKIFKNVHSWFTSDILSNLYNSSEQERLLHFAPNLLVEKMFFAKIKDGDNILRLFKFWPKISGLNWENEFDKFKKIKQQFPNKKTIILLGNYPGANQIDGEKDFIKHVWEKYHNEYVIFYKGHPGHTEYDDYIKNELIPQEAHEGLYILESSISSEELTRDHINDGFIWDGIAVVGNTSALAGFPAPTYDLRNQILSVLSYQPNGRPVISYSDARDSYYNDLIKWMENMKYINDVNVSVVK